MSVVLYVAIFIFIIAVLLLTRLFALKKEVKKISKQLEKYNDRKTNKKIEMALFDKNMEKLGLEINKLIDLYVAENRKRIRYENEQKQAIANMSHDLRTPLTSILGYIQMAEEEDVTADERKELLSIANKRAKRLETLLKDFFELSIIESTDHHLKSEQINLRNLTIDVLISFYDRFQERNMEPTIHIPEKDVFIIADESAVTRVIENLLSNAIVHSDGNIIISLEEQASTVKLSVRNDAYSLTDEDARLMFDRFYKADRSRSGKSTGLGLSIVKSFMEKMSGEVTGHLNEGQLIIICEWKAAE
ncbi:MULTISPECIES: sensor histidine kinase [Niallia]|uniref:sensor histidine kinase n=1 Tax=Niallia TaxID=2837506 RepID=UPI001CFF9FB5|nr:MULTISPECIES: HAMP domain-containing sensor histidine kinase [Niallia]MCB5236891.1 HAMP domain-containing histidine kinase [Niallia circulans]MED3793114.1 HAMP domain-containing sensor histidine kinase [Niallia alba]